MVNTRSAYFIIIKENVDNVIEFENELCSSNYEDAEKEASGVLLGYFNSLARSNPAIDYRDFVAKIEKRIILQEE